jgi:hypothetical protein
MITSDRSPQETREYFENKNYTTIIPFSEIFRSELN